MFGKITLTLVAAISLGAAVMTSASAAPRASRHRLRLSRLMELLRSKSAWATAAGTTGAIGTPTVASIANYAPRARHVRAKGGPV